MSFYEGDDDESERSGPVRSSRKTIIAESRPSAVPFVNPVKGFREGEHSCRQVGQDDEAIKICPAQSHALFVLASVASSLPQGGTAATSTRSTSLSDVRNLNFHQGQISKSDRVCLTKSDNEASSPRAGSLPADLTI